MNFAATETQAPAGVEASPTFVVGYGNIWRRDDGLGPRVVEMIGAALPGPDPRCLIRPQLDLDLIEDLREAGRVILVDATVEELPDGWRREWIQPKPEMAPALSHVVNPGLLANLLEAINGRRPETWLISIQGDDFGFGRGLSPEATRRAGLVARAINRFLNKED